MLPGNIEMSLNLPEMLALRSQAVQIAAKFRDACHEDQYEGVAADLLAAPPSVVVMALTLLTKCRCPKCRSGLGVVIREFLRRDVPRFDKAVREAMKHHAN